MTSRILRALKPRNIQDKVGDVEDAKSTARPHVGGKEHHLERSSGPRATCGSTQQQSGQEPAVTYSLIETRRNDLRLRALKSRHSFRELNLTSLEKKFPNFYIGCAEYAPYFFNYLFAKEEFYRISEEAVLYSSFDKDMRLKLLNMIVGAVMALKISNEIFFMAIRLWSRYLAALKTEKLRCGISVFVEKEGSSRSDNLMDSEGWIYSALACLWLAMKLEIRCFDSEFRRCFTLTKVLKPIRCSMQLRNTKVVEHERHVLSTLRFDLQSPSCYAFFQLLILVSNLSPDESQVASFILESSAISELLVARKESLRAAAAVWLTLRLTRPHEGRAVWNSTMQYYSHYGIDQIQPVARTIYETVRVGHTLMNSRVRMDFITEKYKKIVPQVRKWFVSSWNMDD